MPRNLRRRAVAVTVGALVASPAVTAHALTPSPSVPLSPVSAALVRGLQTATDLGALPATQEIGVTVVLDRPDAAGEAAFRTAVSTPGSPEFRHFLTPAQFAARFGVSDATATTAETWLTRAGLTEVSVSAPRDVYALRGTVAQIDATFGVAMHSFRTTAGKGFFANTTAPLLPSSLPVVDVLGLQTFHTIAAHPQQDTCVGGTCTGDTTAQDLWKAYALPGAYTGKGQQVATFGLGAYDYVVTDLRSFEKAESLPVMPVRISLVDGTSAKYTDTSGDGEWQIDTQSASGMAPDADGLVMYWADDSQSDASFQNMASVWTNDAHGPMQASASFGECEAQPLGLGSQVPGVAYDTVAFQQAYDKTLQQAVAEGKTLFASSGDNGSSCGNLPVDLNGLANEGPPQVDYPASSPYVVGVGGTVLYTDATTHERSLEYTWTFGGGGSSVLYPEPAWQKAVGGVVQPCLGDPDGTPDPAASTCRGVPDISSQSGDVAGNGFLTYDKTQGGTFSGGGTSLSSPMSEGMWARVQQAVGGAGAGFADPVYYYWCNDVFDVGQTGNTQTTQAGNGAYLATDGWDYATGLGVPAIGQLASDASKVTPGQTCAGAVPGTQVAAAPARPAAPAAAAPTSAAATTGTAKARFTPLGFASLGAVKVTTAGTTVAVVGRSGIPARGVDQVLLSLTTSRSSAASMLRGVSKVLVPTTPGRIRHALVLVRPDVSGHVLVRADKGSTLLGVAAVGYSSTTSPSALTTVHKVLTKDPATLTPGHDVVLSLPGVPSGAKRKQWAAVLHLTVAPTGKDGVLSATVGGTRALTGVSTYVAGLRSTATVVVRASASGTVRLHVSAGSVRVTASEVAAWVPGAAGSAFGSWPQGRVTAV